MDMNNDNEAERNAVKKGFFHIETQGSAFLSILALMGILYRVNPFIKFTKTLLKANRLLYSILFLLFLVEVVLFYVYDPFNLVKPYFGILIPIIVGIGAFLLAMVMWYTVQFSDSDVFQSAESMSPKPVASFFFKTLIIIGSIGMSAMLIGWIVYYAEKLSKTSYVVALILNILLVISILAFVYKIMEKSSILQSSPFLRLIVNSLLYIPCIFANIADYIVKAYYGEKDLANKSEMLISLAIIVLFLLYFIVPYALFKLNRGIEGGKQLVNYPVPISNTSVLGNYFKLNDLNPDDVVVNYDYDYAMSFWFYIDAASPNISSSYNKYTSICNYGGKPEILYKADDNTMIVVVDVKDLDEQKARNPHLELHNDKLILTKIEGVKLQKWNHVLVNYDAGTMDVFFNGTLIKSAINIVPYMSLDTLKIGDNPGISASVCNFIYYNYALDGARIRNLYTSVKDNTPPVPPYSDPNPEIS